MQLFIFYVTKILSSLIYIYKPEIFMSICVVINLLGGDYAYWLVIPRYRTANWCKINWGAIFQNNRMCSGDTWNEFPCSMG